MGRYYWGVEDVQAKEFTLFASKKTMSQAPTPPADNDANQAIAARYASAIKNGTINEELTKAVVSQDLAGAQFLLSRNADPNGNPKDSADPNLLLVAAKQSNAEMVKLLLNYRADINKKLPDGSNVLLEMVREQNPEMTSILLEHCPNLMLTDKNGRNMLLEATTQGNPEVFNMILRAAPSYLLNEPDKDGRTPLGDVFTKVGNGDYRFYHMAEQLLLAGANPDIVTHNCNNASNITLLHDAAYEGNEEKILLLLQNKANPNVVMHKIANVNDGYAPGISNPEGITPLHLAARAINDNAKVTALLVEAKANINARDASGQTPLMLAVEAGNLRIAEYLLANGADPRLCNKDGKNSIELARDRAQISSSNSVTNEDRQTLSHALDSSQSGSPDDVPVDINSIKPTQVGFNYADGSDIPPLDKSEQDRLSQNQNRAARLMAALLEDVGSGARIARNRVVVSHTAPDDMYPHDEEQQQQTPPSKTSEQQDDPFYNALMTGHVDEAMNLIKQGKGNVNGHYGTQEMTPLMIAAVGNDKKMITALREAGADPNAGDLVQWGALHYAVKNYGLDAIDALLAHLPGKADTNPEARDFGGMRAFDLAKTEKDYAAMAKLGLAMHVPEQNYAASAPVFVPQMQNSLPPYPQH